MSYIPLSQALSLSGSLNYFDSELLSCLSFVPLPPTDFCEQRVIVSLFSYIPAGEDTLLYLTKLKVDTVFLHYFGSSSCLHKYFGFIFLMS